MGRSLRFFTCDVFTDRRFGGNQLAVLPEADGLSTAEMQTIAAEFGYSETTFVLRPDDPEHLARVRIFTPRFEMPFAGHPTVGTALTLAWLGRFAPDADGAARIVFEMRAGPVPVEIRYAAGRAVTAEFKAPRRPEIGPKRDAAPIAAALGLDPADLVTTGPTPCDASCGAGFLFVEVASLGALARARLAAEAAAAMHEHGTFLFTRPAGEPGAHVQARMFAPHHGIVEDPATGSAAAALAGLLAARSNGGDGERALTILQGVEMGRRSVIRTRAAKRAGEIDAVYVAGEAVAVMEGTLTLD